MIVIKFVLFMMKKIIVIYVVVLIKELMILIMLIFVKVIKKIVNGYFYQQTNQAAIGLHVNQKILLHI